jgi:hypothetical protein
MVYLISSASVALVFGVLFVFFSGLCKRLCRVLDQVLFILDEKLHPFKFWIGILLLVVAGWKIYLVLPYPELYHLHPFWMIALIFGFLFIFFPNWLRAISGFMDRVVFTTDKYVEAFSLGIGLLLIIASGYIFFMAYTIS